MDHDPMMGVHATATLHDPLVLVVKYRREVFTEVLSGFSRGVVSGFADNYGVEINNPEPNPDYVHSRSKTTFTTDLAKFDYFLNCAFARRNPNEYRDQIEENLWGDSLWTNSYWPISPREVSLDLLDEYFENQREPADG